MNMRRITTLLLVGLLLSACTVLEYRDVQRDFELAVQADNERSVSPFTDATADYSAVFAKLTPTYIAKLDVRMRPNAWMLRGVCAWRTALYEDARAAAASGLGVKPGPGVGSRDLVLLTMLPGLVFESETAARWHATADKTEAVYDGLKNDMKSAWATLVDAEGKMGEATPPGTRSYLHYQKWRVASNWAQMIIDLGGDDFGLITRMNNWAKTEGDVGSTPGTAANDAKTQVKGQLLALIEAQSTK
jgi:hypothetical protein